MRSKAGRFVVAACGTVSKEMQELMCQGDPQKEALSRVGGGYARIFAPDGQSIGNVLEEQEEGLVIADIDLGMIALAKAAADPAGHYSRPDVTRLLLNSRSQRPVMHFDEAAGFVVETGDFEEAGKHPTPTKGLADKAQRARGAVQAGRHKRDQG